MVNCPSCNKSAGKETTIMCTVCKHWIHKSCSGLAPDIWDMFKSLSEKGIKNAFRCNCCSAAWDKMEERIAQNAAEIAKLKDEVFSHSTSIKEHDTKIATIEDDISVIKEKQDSGDTASTATKAALNEVAEIESRRHNLLLYKMKEPANNVKGADRKEADLEELEKVLKSIDCQDCHADVTNSYRAGKPANIDNPPPRPYILTFASHSTKAKILKNARKLANTEFKHISIQHDLTQNQRKNDKDLWDEAAELNIKMDDEEAKNWEWKPWGPPGCKRLRKMRRRDMDVDMNETTSRTTGADKRRLSPPQDRGQGASKRGRRRNP